MAKNVSYLRWGISRNGTDLFPQKMTKQPNWLSFACPALVETRGVVTAFVEPKVGWLVFCKLPWRFFKTLFVEKWDRSVWYFPLWHSTLRWSHQQCIKWGIICWYYSMRCAVLRDATAKLESLVFAHVSLGVHLTFLRVSWFDRCWKPRNYVLSNSLKSHRSLDRDFCS